MELAPVSAPTAAAGSLGVVTPDGLQVRLWLWGRLTRLGDVARPPEGSLL